MLSLVGLVFAFLQHRRAGPLILGVILIAFVLLVPKGLVPTIADWAGRIWRLRMPAATMNAKPKSAAPRAARHAATAAYRDGA